MKLQNVLYNARNIFTKAFCKYSNISVNHMTAPYLCRFKTTRSGREWTWSKVSLIVRPNQTFYFRLRFE